MSSSRAFSLPCDSKTRTAVEVKTTGVNQTSRCLNNFVCLVVCCFLSFLPQFSDTISSLLNYFASLFFCSLSCFLSSLCGFCFVSSCLQRLSCFSPFSFLCFVSPVFFAELPLFCVHDFFCRIRCPTLSFCFFFFSPTFHFQSTR